MRSSLLCFDDHSSCYAEKGSCYVRVGVADGDEEWCGSEDPDKGIRDDSKPMVWLLEKTCQPLGQTRKIWGKLVPFEHVHLRCLLDSK